ncbi:hypothetical protein D3C78_1717190 [compost metagenome]
MDLVCGTGKSFKFDKDENGIFLRMDYFSKDNLLLKTSILSGGVSPTYSTRTDTYYDREGNIIDTVERTLLYDSDGDIVGED